MRPLTTILLIAFFALLTITSLLTGPYTRLTPEALAECLTAECPRTLQGVLAYRAYRTAAAILVGAGLAASGLTVQYALRNPLADPYLLGVSAGAALGVIGVYAFTPNPSPALVYVAALASGTLAFAIVLSMGHRIGSSPTALIVAGVSVSYAITGATIILMIRLADRLPYAFAWLFGTVAYPVRSHLAATTIITMAGITVLVLLGPRLYTLILGDEVSTSLGVDVKRLRLASLGAAAAIAASLVALAGPVGFIGLVAPWMTRMIYGSRFQTVLTRSLLLGASLAIASDLLARTLVQPGEAPLTALTALFGGPLLFYLSKKTGW